MDHRHRDARTHGRRTLGLVVGLMTGAAVLLAPTPAWADPCGDDGTTKIFDAEGNYFDFSQGSTTGADHDGPFATFSDSGSNGPADTPPGARSASDAYDDWGALFVGGMAEANMYHSNDNDACALEEGGRERVYPVVNVGGLDVQRKIFVAESGLPGARILNLITNPGASPVTTSIQIGDLQSAADEGDVGSDGDTIVGASSSGEPVASPDDLWFATTEEGDDTSGDPAIGHLMDGPGAFDLVDEVFVASDGIAWRWNDVTIAPGQTVAYVSFQVLQVDASGEDAPEIANVVEEANGYLAASPDVLFTGMSQTERDAVRNWHSNVPDLAEKAKKRQRVGKIKVTVTCETAPCEVDAGGTASTRIPVGAIRTKAPKVLVESDLGPVTQVLLQGESATLRLRPARKELKALRALIKKGYRGKAVVTLDLAVPGGTQETRHRIRLRP
ncbi:MAG: hypothetical protein ACRDJP_15835 [Actinomycetota bacterium]